MWSFFEDGCNITYSTVLNSNCPQEWQSIDASCYLPQLQRKSWRDASRICQDKCASLAWINDMNELQAVGSMVRGTSGRGRREFWLGGNCETNCKCVWMTNATQTGKTI